VCERSKTLSFFSPSLSCPFSPVVRAAAARVTPAGVVRLLACAGGALAAAGWLDADAIGFLIATVSGSCAYASLAACAAVRDSNPHAGAAAQRGACHETEGETSHVPITPIYFAGC
jgi:hypothetical protein